MKIHFIIPYFTRWGQRILVSGNIQQLGNGDHSKALPLTHDGHENWYGEIECETASGQSISYTYVLYDESAGKYTEEWGDNRTVSLLKNADNYYCYDTWNAAGSVENVFMTSPFRKVLLRPDSALPQAKDPKNFTHKFIVKAPLLKPNQMLCMLHTARPNCCFTRRANASAFWGAS